MPKATRKKYTANIRVDTIVGVSIVANTLEEALVEARKLGASDCIDHVGENVDTNITLVGVSGDAWISYE